jgi:hypothetical protein
MKVEMILSLFLRRGLLDAAAMQRSVANRPNGGGMHFGALITACSFKGHGECLPSKVPR